MKSISLPGNHALACIAALALLVTAGCTGQGGGETSQSPSGAVEGAGESPKPAADRQEDWFIPRTLDADTVAIVDGMKISADEFDAALASAAFLAKQGTYEGRLDIIMGRIDSLLARNAAIQAGYLERPAVARAIDRVRRRNTVWPVRRKILEQAAVSDEELEAAFVEPGAMLDLTVLLAESLEVAEASLARVQAGEAFEDVALEVSISPGTLASNVQRKGLVRGAGMYPPAVEEAVFALEVGEISPPYETPVGYLVVRIDDRRYLSDDQVAAMRESEREMLLGRERNKVLADALAKLRDAAEITILRENFRGDDLPGADGMPFEAWRRLGEIEVAVVDGTILTMNDVFRNMGDYKLMHNKTLEAQEGAYKMLRGQQVDEVLLYNLGKKDNVHQEPGIERIVNSNTIGILVGEYSSDTAFQVTEEDLDMERCRGFLDERRAVYLDDERLALSSILVRHEADAQKVMDRLGAGGDFADLAREYSVDGYAASGGDMGTLREDEIALIFGDEGAEELVRRGRQGEREALLLRTTSGYHVVQVGKLYEIGEGSLDEASVRSLVLPDFLAFCRFEAVDADRNRLRQQAEIIIDVDKILNYEPPPGPPPGFHGGSISVPEGGSAPHPGGGRPSGHP